VKTHPLKKVENKTKRMSQRNKISKFIWYKNMSHNNGYGHTCGQCRCKFRRKEFARTLEVYWNLS
jgi:hypothetical protein